MSIGMLLLVTSVARIGWRLMHEHPPLPDDMNVASRFLARATHAFLYAYVLVVPLIGWAVLSSRKRPPLLFGSVHWPNIPLLADMSRSGRAALHDVALQAHVWLSYAGVGLFALHVGAALYHHFHKRDDVLRRLSWSATPQSPHAGGGARHD